MTHYEKQLARIAKYPTRHRVLIKTAKFLMFVVDEEVVYCHEFDETGQCVNASWHLAEK